ncbi:MAG: DUF494 domain-containing protein [Gammaproteobacteria bacterium]|nr:MAG: DUF494 domain-containing protein [Gammaproteobacteria bacterium]
MKENMLDILMYLFENFSDEDMETETTQEVLKTDLAAAGFPEREIDKAFAWLEGLSAQHDLQSFHPPKATMRLFNGQEVERMDLKCRGFLLFLEQIGVLDTATRELVIDRVMALEAETDLEQLKWVILMVLFNQPGQEAALAWMEDLVFNEKTQTLH